MILTKIGGKNPYETVHKLALANYYAKEEKFFLDFKLVILTIISIFSLKLY